MQASSGSVYLAAGTPIPPLLAVSCPAVFLPSVPSHPQTRTPTPRTPTHRLQFCKQCALEHAGLGRAIGTFTNLCSYVSPGVACPQCRQPAVYRKAVRMRQLDKVLKTRCARCCGVRYRGQLGKGLGASQLGVFPV